MQTTTDDTRATEYMAGRLDELERENAQLKREVQQAHAERDVAKGNAQTAMAERVAAQDLAGRLTAEERATQLALAEQGSNFPYVNVMLMLNFLLALAIALGLFAWLPNRVADQVRVQSAAVAPAPPGSVTVVPTR